MDLQDLAAIVAGSFLLLLNAWEFVRKRQWQFWLVAIRELTAKIYGWRTCRIPPKTIELFVEEAVHKRRLEHLRDFFTMKRVLFSCWFCHMLVMRVLFGMKRYHTGLQDACFFCGYGMCVLVFVRPSLLSTKTMDIFYSISMLLLAMYHAPVATSRDYFPLAFTYTLVIGGVASLGSLRSPLVLFWNAMCIATAWASVQLLGADQELRRLFGGRVLCTFMICLYAFLVESRWREQARRDIEGQMLRERTSAFRALMSRFYDVVTELDAHLVVASTGCQLARFLQCETLHSLEGINFVELFHHEEERTLFVERTNQPVKEPDGVADLLHVTLRFGPGHVRQVELFTFQFPSIMGGRRFLLGIRDCGEQTPLQLRDLPSSAASSIGMAGNETVALQNFSVIVNTTEPGLPVLWCSVKFEQLFGVGAAAQGTEGVGFRDIVENADDVETWIQMVMNMYGAGEPERAVRRANSCRVLLKSHRCPDGTTSRSPAMRCKIMLGHDLDEDSFEHVYLNFFQPSSRKQAPQRTAGSSNGSSLSISTSRGTPRSLGRHHLGHHASI